MTHLRAHTMLLALSAVALIQCGTGPDAESAADMPQTAQADEALTTGQVEVHLLGDSVSYGTLVSSPISAASVYDGDWHAGNVLGQTDANGVYLATLATGAHYLSVMKMTSSHSILESTNNYVNVGTTKVRLDIHVAPTQVELNSTYNVGYGYALYVTGETSYLGNWQTAYKMTWNGSAWDYMRNLPIGAQFKVIRAPWTDAATISTASAGVQWEKGSNRTIPAPYQSYQSYVQIYPTF